MYQRFSRFREIMKKIYKIDVIDDWNEIMKESYVTKYHLWEKIKTKNKDEWLKKINFILTQFGTSLHCNRFDVGNMIEFSIADFLRELDFEVEELPNASRIDMIIHGYGSLSIKYSSGKEVILHNSQRKINNDYDMKDTLLITPNDWWFLNTDSIYESGVMLEEYLKNNGDSLSLNLKILKELRSKKYPFYLDCKLSNKKEECMHKQCSKLVYEIVNILIKNDKTDEHKVIENLFQNSYK